VPPLYYRVFSPAAPIIGPQLHRRGAPQKALHQMLAICPARHGKLCSQDHRPVFDRDDLQQQMDGADIDAILYHLHTLKGSSGTMGATRLSRHCAKLEQAFRTDPQAALAMSEWITALPTELEQAVSLLEAEVVKLEQTEADRSSD
tara:strand:+ start:569 stop:1006 length:438 start_codon:yes stop_codon:yes gene_type:complete